MTHQWAIAAVTALALHQGPNGEPVAAPPPAAERPALVATPAPLAPEIRQRAVILSTLSSPGPSEIFAAFALDGRPEWAAFYPLVIHTKFSSRPQIVMNVGALLTDCALAIQARDAGRLSNYAQQDLLALHGALGLPEDPLRVRTRHLALLAEKSRWPEARTELEALRNDLQQLMINNRDDAYLSLLALGGWLRGMQIIAAMLDASYTPGRAELLAQSQICLEFRQRLDDVPERLRRDGSVQSVMKEMKSIEFLMAAPPDSPLPQATIREISSTLARLMGEVRGKD